MGMEYSLPRITLALLVSSMMKLGVTIKMGFNTTSSHIHECSWLEGGRSRVQGKLL